MGRLEDKVVIVTGAAGGQGESHARTIVREGGKVVISDINEEKGKETAEDIGKNSLFIKHDITNEEDWKKVVDQTLEVFGTIDGLVNNAGMVEPVGPVEDLDLDVFQKVIQLNLVGTFLGIKSVVPYMKENKKGSIINISSQAGVQGNAFASGYVSTKFAVTGLTKAVALEVATDNVRVNSVHPGVVETPGFFKGQEELAGEFIAQIPTQKAQTPQEISNIILYLLSDESSGSTGSEFFVDGGMNS